MPMRSQPLRIGKALEEITSGFLGRLQLAGPLDVTLYTRSGCHLCDEAKTRMVSVRIPERLFSNIKKLADSERRSVANVALLLLEQGLDRYKSPRANRSKVR